MGAFCVCDPFSLEDIPSSSGQTNPGDKIMESIWIQTAALPDFPRLEQSIKTDVLIIGGGLAGILCAHYLHQVGISCTLVESRQLCGGVSGNTTAKITAQHGLVYHKLLRRFGSELTRMYLKANLEAVDRYRELSSQFPCDFEEKDSFVYTTGSAGPLENELSALDQIGFSADLVKNLPLPFDVTGAVRFGDQAQFHPLKLAAALVPGLNIYENTPVISFDGHAYRTPGGKITADKAIVATHFPIFNKHGGYFLKMYQHRSYVIALKGGPDVGGMYVDADKKGLSFRNYGDHLLLGGGSHRTGKTGGGWAELQELSKTWYPNARETALWATQDCMTLDDIPYIGQYSKHTPDLYVATGFHKWGMTGAMVSAMLLTEEIQGRQHLCAPAFSPQRTIARPQLLGNILESALNLLTPTAPRCPHLGCALKWNKAEHTWDCPCHGSRFDKDGKLLDTPATGDLPDKKHHGRG